MQPLQYCRADPLKIPVLEHKLSLWLSPYLLLYQLLWWNPDAMSWGHSSSPWIRLHDKVWWLLANKQHQPDSYLSEWVLRVGAILKVGTPVPVKPSNDCIPRQHLDYNPVRDREWDDPMKLLWSSQLSENRWNKKYMFLYATMFGDDLLQDNW